MTVVTVVTVVKVVIVVTLVTVETVVSKNLFFHQKLLLPNKKNHKKTVSTKKPFSPKESTCDKNQTQLRMWQNSKCETTQKPKMWQDTETQNVTKLKNSKCNRTEQLKMSQN